MRQRQFLDVVDESVAHARFGEACRHLLPRVETVQIADAHGRVLATDVMAAVDVPGFDRSNMDGFAVRAQDTFGAEELAPVRLSVHPTALAAGDVPGPGVEVSAGTAVQIATGGVVPRGADAVVMVEDTQAEGSEIVVTRPSVPGGNVTFAGSDIGRGEVVMRVGTPLGSRETGVIAAVGVATVEVFDRPVVAVLSTGDEIVAPGNPLGIGQVYDSNQRILIDAITELGGASVAGGILPDDAARLEREVRSLIEDAGIDIVLLSGGTSKGEGDLNAVVVERLAAAFPDSPGVVVHGVALKPGKPVLLSVIDDTPVVVLPGFPTSAIFTFHEFVAPLIRRLAGSVEAQGAVVGATAPFRIDGAPGRTQYALVDLVEGPDGLVAYPLGAGSGSVTAFARADGFIRIPASVEFLDEGAPVEVRLIEPDLHPADLVVIGSHCIGLDHLLGLVAAEGFRVKMIPVGSTAGLVALARGEGDVAGVHLLDPETGVYNQPFLPSGVRLVKGYGRRQGIAFRPEDVELGNVAENEIPHLLGATARRMVNRNPGAGTRVLIDGLLGGARPDGYHHQAKTHHAVAAAIEQRRADWGMTLDTVAARAGLAFRFVANEDYDVAIRADRWGRPAVVALRRLLAEPRVRAELAELGFEVSDAE